MKRGAMVLFLLGLCAILVLSEIHMRSPSASVVSDFGELRQDRINLYLNFPNYADNRFHQTLIDRTRTLIRMNAQGSYYSDFGIYDPNIFFNNEYELVDTLMVLACMKQPQYVSYQVPGYDINNLGVLPCNPQLQQTAVNTLYGLMDVDIRLMERMTPYACQSAYQSIAMAKESTNKADFVGTITNLKATYQHILDCA